MCATSFRPGLHRSPSRRRPNEVRSTKNARRAHSRASEASHPVSSVSACRIPPNVPPAIGGSPCGTRRAFRRPAGDAKLVPVGRREASPRGTAESLFFCWPTHALLACERRSRPVRGEAPGMAPALRSEEGRRAERPESKSHGISFASKSDPKKIAFRAKARSDMRDRGVGGPRPALVCSLLPRTAPLHCNAPIRRGLKAVSLGSG